jgi:methylmalonyl-CoA mutase, C-terminal domain
VEERIRVIVAGPGAGGPEPSAEVVARALRDAGMEVIFTALGQTPEQFAATVEQEDADALGVVLAAPEELTGFARLAGLLAERGIDDVALFAGGELADADVRRLRDLGVGRIVAPGTPPEEIVDWVRTSVGGA